MPAILSVLRERVRCQQCPNFLPSNNANQLLCSECTRQAAQMYPPGAPLPLFIRIRFKRCLECGLPVRTRDDIDLVYCNTCHPGTKECVLCLTRHPDNSFRTSDGTIHTRCKKC